MELSTVTLEVLCTSCWSWRSWLELTTYTHDEFETVVSTNHSFTTAEHEIVREVSVLIQKFTQRQGRTFEFQACNIISAFAESGMPKTVSTDLLSGDFREQHHGDGRMDFWA